MKQLASASPHFSENLETLRLPDLQRLFGEVTGEPTRCPNRRYLIRRIVEARRAEPGTAPVSAPRAPVDSEAVAEPPEVAPVAPLPQHAAPPLLHAPAAALPLAPRAEHAVTDAQRHLVRERGRLTSMSLTELQATYLEVVGRPSGSTNSAYLVWKIREAVKGRVRVGPLPPRERNSEAAHMKTLPFRVSEGQLEALDRAWRQHGARNRMHFLRLALGHYLGAVGDSALAALFATNAD